MSAVDPLFAQWLQAEALYTVSVDATLDARWGTKAQSSERITRYAFKADAIAEAARQIAFMGLPLVEDEHFLLGSWRDKIGQVITLTGDKLGYDAGVAVFVIGVQDDRATGTSRVSVLRRLS